MFVRLVLINPDLKWCPGGDLGNRANALQIDALPTSSYNNFEGISYRATRVVESFVICET